MFYVSDPISTPPPVFSSPLQQKVYEAFATLGIPFERVDTDPGLTMEDCQHIDAKIGVPADGILAICNHGRQAIRHAGVLRSAGHSSRVVRPCRQTRGPHRGKGRGYYHSERHPSGGERRPSRHRHQRRQKRMVRLHGRHCHVLREDTHRRPAGEVHPVHVPFSRNYSLIE